MIARLRAWLQRQRDLTRRIRMWGIARSQVTINGQRFVPAKVAELLYEKNLSLKRRMLKERNERKKAYGDLYRVSVERDYLRTELAILRHGFSTAELIALNERHDLTRGQIP